MVVVLLQVEKQDGSQDSDEVDSDGDKDERETNTESF